MPERRYFSDRETGGVPRTLEELPLATWAGIAVLIERRIASNWFAYEFPGEPCPDGTDVVETSLVDLYDSISAVIPRLAFPLDRTNVPDLFDALDLIDFLGQHVAEPRPFWWHSFFKHDHLSFDDEAGRREFRKDINDLFARGGVAFEIDQYMRVRRLGPPESREIVAKLRPNTGDPELDRLIREAQVKFYDVDTQDRRRALERLWDAFERLKTVEAGSDKKARVEALIGHVKSPKLRQVMDAEARALTDIGNSFSIRHHEAGQEPLSDEMIDYFFTRCSLWIVHILTVSGRITS